MNNRQHERLTKCRIKIERKKMDLIACTVSRYTSHFRVEPFGGCIPPSWGYSSVGRAPALQAGGRGFESLYLHQQGRFVFCDGLPWA